MIPDFGTPDSKRKLAIICSKGNLDMAYPGLVLANAALVRASRPTCSSPSGVST
jgi:hypothetical protein